MVGRCDDHGAAVGSKDALDRSVCLVGSILRSGNTVEDVAPAARTIRSERDRLDDPACSVAPGVSGSASRSPTRDTHQRERHAFTWPFSHSRTTPSQCGPGKRCRSCSVPPFSLGSRICVRRLSKLGHPPTLFLAIIVLLRSWPAFACQCGSVPTPREALQKADTVFAGTVASRTPVLVRAFGELIVAERDVFLVRATWAGTSAPRMTLLQGLTNCSRFFAVGQSYLVFASREAGAPADLTSTICLPTQPFARAGVALAEIGPPVASWPQSPRPTESYTHRTLRHGYASFLCGVVLLRAHVRPFQYSYGSLICVFLIAPAAILIALGVVLYLLLRRRFHAVAWLAVPIVVFVLLSVVFEGYMYLRSYPPAWYLLDRLPNGGV